LIGGSYLLSPAKSLKLIFIKQYNQDLILLIYPDSPPVLLSKNTPKINLLNDVKTYLRLNNIHERLFVNDLEKVCIKQPEAINQSQDKITIKYKSFIFDILKSYNSVLDSKANCIKLPPLKGSDPNFKDLVPALSECIIVNDYKRLAKSSFKNINWLSINKKSAYFLSKTGTLEIISDGNSYEIYPVDS